MDPQDRLSACWAIQECQKCTHSRHGCGWCPFSGTCVPTSTLLKPLSHPNTCPLAAERFELRTKALGCGCSTTTLLSVVVTVFATIIALAVLYVLGLGVASVSRKALLGSWSGWELEIEDDASRRGHAWRRSNGLTRFFRRRQLALTAESEQERMTERTRLMGPR